MRESTKLFLDSDRVESDFYSTTKENLVSLREYLEALKKMDKKFEFLSSEELKFIKSKTDWIDCVKFDGVQDRKTRKFNATYLHLFTNDNDEYVVSLNPETGLYEDMADDLSGVFLLNPKVRRHVSRMKDLNTIQGNLKEIDKAGKYIYDDCLDPKKSISGSFKIYYMPSLGMKVTSEEHDSVVTFYEHQLRERDKTYLREDEKEKALDVIQLRKRDLPDVNKQIISKELKLKKDE